MGCASKSERCLRECIYACHESVERETRARQQRISSNKLDTPSLGETRAHGESRFRLGTYIIIISVTCQIGDLLFEFFLFL